MEIFSPGPVPYPGCYQCPRCNSREVYDSEKTIGVSAMTIDVPGPVNSTIVNVDKVDAKRCRYCDSVAPYVMHPKAREEFEIRKKSKRKRRLKFLGLAAGGVLGVILAGNITSYIGNQISQNRELSDTKKATEEIEKIHVEWQAASDACGLNYSVNKDLEGDPVHESGFVDVYIRIENAQKLSAFWNSEKGLALDCFSEKVAGTRVSRYFIYSDDQIPKLNDMQSIHLYDQNFTNETVVGLLGADEHLAGYFAFFKKSDHTDFDNFAISLSWELNKG
jgi:hypothetical protein